MNAHSLASSTISCAENCSETIVHSDMCWGQPFGDITRLRSKLVYLTSGKKQET